MSKTKAVALLSGGLDSILAVKIMLNQGIEIHPICFIIPFSTSSKTASKLEARKVSDKFGIPLKVKFLGQEYIEIVKNPLFGYGKNMNPCIDCRLFMLRKAKVYMQDIGAEFIITGEVLGQRPMTQNKETIKLIETKSGLDNRILRPLSAKLFEPTIAEQKNWIKRENLFAIEGRSRKLQMKLAEEFGILDYPTPAGGCLLADSSFAKKIKDAFEHKEDSLREITLLKYGRHFRLPSNAKAIVGRDEKENKIILALRKKSSICMEAVNVPGPITILLKPKRKIDIETSASICLRYSDYIEEKGKVLYWQNKKEKSFIVVKKIRVNELEEIRI
jgi:tRNA U34 2-thiouridine synthase MnmA/TrmU